MSSLQGGPCTCAGCTSRDGSGRKLESFFAESFVLPIGTDGEACCVLQFATTNIEQSRRFSELFGAIAATFRMFRPDDPTDF